MKMRELLRRICEGQNKNVEKLKTNSRYFLPASSSTCSSASTSTSFFSSIASCPHRETLYLHSSSYYKSMQSKQKFFSYSNSNSQNTVIFSHSSFQYYYLVALFPLKMFQYYHSITFIFSQLLMCHFPR